MMDREAKRAAILAIAAGAFGVGLLGYTVATTDPTAESRPPESKGGGPGEGAQASCNGPNGCEGRK